MSREFRAGGRPVLVTGSAGLIGSEVASYFLDKEYAVVGIDNNMRAEFFGPPGDTTWNRKRLQDAYPGYTHLDLDIRARTEVLDCISYHKPILLVHAAAQPSHDLAASRPFDDFDVNAVGTLNLLEGVRQYSGDTVFVYLSTNKVYGDAPNRIRMIEKQTRWDYADSEWYEGIDESFTIDQSKHSIFGASKVAADVMVQEYGRYFGIASCVLRGGCLTGPNHSGVELHGFLSYLIKTNVEERLFRIFGYKGKQVRDNIHALDVARFIDRFFEAPRVAEVYNIGGGRQNSCSILEAFQSVRAITGKEMKAEYVEKAREGDHICYITNLRKAKEHYPGWGITVPLEQVFVEVARNWETRSVLR